MSKSIFNVIRNEKGIVLLIALMVLIMLSLMGLAAILTGTTDIQIAGNSAHSTQALYLAEAGVGRVKSWFETPPSFNPPAGSYTLIAGNKMTPYADTDMQSFFRKRRNDQTDYITGGVSQFTDTNNVGGVTSADANNGNDDGKTTDQNNAVGTQAIPVDAPALSIKNGDYFADGTAAGRDYLNSLFQDLSGMGLVTALEVYPPMNNANYATVRVTAVDSAGAKRTIEEEIGPSQNVPITGGLNAGIGAASNGNASTHWGSVLVKGDFTANDTKSTHCYNHLVPGSCGGPDDITSAKGEADKWWSLDATGNVSVGGLTLPDSNYKITPNSGKTPEKFPQTTKDFLKQAAIQTGNYYVYCSSDGTIYKADGQGHPTGAATTLQTVTQGVTSNAVYYVGKGDASCSPPSTQPTFQINGGGGYYTNSNIVVEGSVSFSGLGGTTNIQAQNPDEVTNGTAGSRTLGVHFNGLIYAMCSTDPCPANEGRFDSGGNPVVYGAVIAEGGFTGSGTPDIWYNANLRDGLPGLPKTSVQRWREIRPQ